jgi:hypothetical protein
MHVPYCHQWPVWLYNAFLHNLKNDMIFGQWGWGGGSYGTQNVCFHFLHKFSWNIFHFRNNWARYDQKMYISLHIKYLLFLPVFNDTWISLTDFQKILIYQISQKSIRWEPNCSMQMDIYDEAGSLFFSPCNFVNTPKNWECWWKQYLLSVRSRIIYKAKPLQWSCLNTKKRHHFL